MFGLIFLTVIIMIHQVAGYLAQTSRLILFTRNKKSPRNSMRIFAHTYYANDLGEPMAIKSSTQMYLDNAWDKWHDLQLEGWTFEELELPESV